jgi:hypothetical protein
MVGSVACGQAYGLGAAVGRAAGVEVREERGLPLPQSAAEAGDLGHGQVGKVSTTRSAIRRPSTGLGCRYAARSRGRRSRRARPQGAPRWRRSRQRAVASVGRKVLGAGAEQHPDPVQPITLAAAVSAGGLLDPAAARIDGASAKLDDVERIERGRGRAWSQITPARGTSARLRRRRPPAALRRTGAGALAPSAGAGSRALEPATGPEPRRRS